MFVKFLLWADNKIAELRDRYDKCHICREPADHWCENCELRHCFDCEWGGYEDVNCCMYCQPTEAELEEMRVEQDCTETV